MRRSWGKNSAPVPGRARAGGGARAAGAGKARAEASAAVARWDCCRAVGPVSAAGPAGGRGGSGRASQQAREGGCVSERATWDRGPGASACPCPTRAAAPLPALACVSEGSAPASPNGVPTPPAARPCLRLAPTSASRRRPQPHVTPAPLFPCLRLVGTRLTLGARPFVSSEPASSCHVLFPRFPHAGGSPHPASGGYLFTQFCFFFRPTPAFAVLARGQRFRPLDGPQPLRFRGGPQGASGQLWKEARLTAF